MQSRAVKRKRGPMCEERQRDQLKQSLIGQELKKKAYAVLNNQRMG